jgi:hypothetical protein
MGSTSADTGAIHDLSKKIKGLELKLDDPLGLLNNLTVKPGDFPAGNDLTTTVDQRRNECIQFLNYVKDQLDQIGGKLGTATADSYIVVEYGNSNAASGADY